MNCRKGLLAAVSLLFVVFMPSSIEILNARVDVAAPTFAAAPTPKQQCVNACRARYHDCRRQKQVPGFECQNVYQDCVRFSCTGLGPG